MTPQVRLYSFGLALVFTACGENIDMTKPEPNPMPTVTEHRGPDGQLVNISFSENYVGVYPQRVVVVDAAGKTIASEVLHGPPTTPPEPLTDEEREMIRAGLENAPKNPSDPAIKNVLAEFERMIR